MTVGIQSNFEIGYERVELELSDQEKDRELGAKGSNFRQGVDHETFRNLRVQGSGVLGVI